MYFQRGPCRIDNLKIRFVRKRVNFSVIDLQGFLFFAVLLSLSIILNKVLSQNTAVYVFAGFENACPLSSFRG